MADVREEIRVKADPKMPVAVKTPATQVVDHDAIPQQAESLADVDQAVERARKKALIVTALERGVVHDRLKVDLPPDLYGEWVRRDPYEIAAKERLGFWIDDKYAVDRSLHNDGTGKPQVGDAVFMITTRENKELIDEVKRDLFLEHHAPRGRRAKEEKDFEANVSKDTAGEIPPLVESEHRSAEKLEIAAALGVLQQQTAPQQ